MRAVRVPGLQYPETLSSRVSGLPPLGTYSERVSQLRSVPCCAQATYSVGQVFPGEDSVGRIDVASSVVLLLLLLAVARLADVLSRSGSLLLIARLITIVGSALDKLSSSAALVVEVGLGGPSSGETLGEEHGQGDEGDPKRDLMERGVSLGSQSIPGKLTMMPKFLQV